ncbi:MAG: ABC transporter ATP-binding protein, partial [Planctomycetota bacterium]
VAEVALPWLTGRLIDTALLENGEEALSVLVIAYLVAVTVFSVAVGIFIRLAGRVATGVAYDLRTKSFARLQELEFAYFDTRPVGWLVTRVTSDCQKLSNLIPWFALDLCWGTCVTIGIVIAMFWLNWQLAIAVLVIVPPLVLVSVFFQRRLLASSRQMRKTNSQITADFNECLTGVRTTKALVREADSLQEFQKDSGTMFAWSTRNALQSAVYLPLVILLGSVGVGLSLWRGGVLTLDDNAGLTLGTLIAFMQYATLFHMPIEELSRWFTMLQSAQAAAERVQGLLDTDPKIIDSPEVQAAIADQSRRLAEDPELYRHLAHDGGAPRIQNVEFRDVTFWYKEGEPVLRDFSLKVHAGETIALVGATGSGKSTIVSLLARFYEPQQGEVLVDDVEYRQRGLHWLQSNLGVVLQSPHLFSGTIAENIRYGRLDASLDEVMEAARTVNAHEFIVELDKGYETEVGEGGARLSTGQRQLIALARAVLADPQIFIMDEATSSVDTETEAKIQKAIDVVLKDRMAFVIAHRLSTIRAADQILVIDQGRLIEQGTHFELMERRGAYHRLYTRQFAHEREMKAMRSGNEPKETPVGAASAGASAIPGPV